MDDIDGERGGGGIRNEGEVNIGFSLSRYHVYS